MAYLSGVMSDTTADPARRDRCAIALLPFEHARPGDLTLKQKRELAAQAAFTRRFQPGKPPAGVAQSWQELIEGPDPTRAQ